MHFREFPIYIHVLYLYNSNEYNRQMILFLDKIKLVVFDLISLNFVILAKNTKIKTICKWHETIASLICQPLIFIKAAITPLRIYSKPNDIESISKSAKKMVVVIQHAEPMCKNLVNLESDFNSISECFVH